MSDSLFYFGPVPGSDSNSPGDVLCCLAGGRPLPTGHRGAQQEGGGSTCQKSPELDPRNYRQILGARFFFGEAAEAVALGARGGLVVFPSAPVLVATSTDPATQTALVRSDLVIPDSGLMVLFWNFLKREHLRRVSGLAYLRLLLESLRAQPDQSVMWVMPTEKSMETSIQWLRRNGHPTARTDCYLAPVYPTGEIEDTDLLGMVQARRPRHLIIAVGGGVQERLGLYLRDRLDYRPAIYCTGAAIGFLSGEQANIPTWADRYYLGWLARCCQNPAKFVPRYWAAKKLLGLMLRYGVSAPAIVPR